MKNTLIMLDGIQISRFSRCLIISPGKYLPFFFHPCFSFSYWIVFLFCINIFLLHFTTPFLLYPTSPLPPPPPPLPILLPYPPPPLSILSTLPLPSIPLPPPLLLYSSLPPTTFLSPPFPFSHIQRKHNRRL